MDPEGPPIIHHKRQADATILTTLIAAGPVFLDPPGISLELAAIFGGA